MFAVGDVVKVRASESDLDGEFGEVVLVGKENIVVIFSPNSINRTAEPWNRDGRKRTFKPDQLEKGEGWDPEERTQAIFSSGMWHSLYTCLQPLDTEDECCVKGCHKKVARRGLMNFWGSVYEIDVCPEHFVEYHGKCTESFEFGSPSRKAFQLESAMTCEAIAQSLGEDVEIVEKLPNTLLVRKGRTVGTVGGPWRFFIFSRFSDLVERALTFAYEVNES